MVGVLLVVAHWFEGVCYNSRHPSPRRVWKVGSGARLLAPLPGNLVDLLDPLESSETFIFEHPSITLSHLACKAPPQERLQDALEPLRASGSALGAP